MPLSHNIKRFRLLKKIKVQELAKLMEVNRQTIYNWERGTNEPSIDDIGRLANIFQVEKILLLDDKHTGGSTEAQLREIQRKYIEKLERDIEIRDRAIEVYRQRLIEAGLDTSVPEQL